MIRLALCSIGGFVSLVAAFRACAALIPDDHASLTVFVFLAIVLAIAWGHFAATTPAADSLVSFPVKLERGETYVLQIRREFTMHERALMLREVGRVQDDIGCKFFVLDKGLELVTAPLPAAEKGGQA